MPKVRFHNSEEKNWQTVRSLAVPETLDRFSEKELSSTLYIHEEGTSNSLQLIEVKYLPGVLIDRHAHNESGIYYVLSGELMVGSRAMGPGSSVFISSQTLYGLKAGPQGAHFLAFRPRADLSYIHEDEYRLRRQSEEQG